MAPSTPTVDNDIIDAVREDEIESMIADARARQEARDG
jgi:hypothetical protein